MVYDRFCAAVVNAQLNCSDIITGSKLAEQMQVSKASVREALLMLCRENVLPSLPRTGYLVTNISPAQAGKLAEARIAMETTMLEMGWSHIGPDQVQEMCELHNRLSTDAKDRASIYNRWEGNMQFHLKLGGQKLSKKDGKKG